MSKDEQKEPKDEPKKTKVTKPKFKGEVKFDFKIDGKSYRKGDLYSTTDEHRYNKLLNINKIKAK